jgi:pimeloyl-ACP methyl ester carboxylesterase
MRRVPLALTGLENIVARYNTDPARIYVGGFSGGGVTASVIAAAYADVFSGGVFVATSDGLGTDNVPVPPLDRYRLMQTRGRYVFLVGTEDPINEAITNRAVSAYRDLCVLRVRTLEMINRGHTDASSRYLTSALNYLDSLPEVKADDQASCEQKLQARRADAVAVVAAALAADDRDKAHSKLVDLHEAFGPLAEPEFGRFSNCLAGSQSLKTCAQNPPEAH